jgi:hypothetical protein
VSVDAAGRVVVSDATSGLAVGSPFTLGDEIDVAAVSADGTTVAWGNGRTLHAFGPLPLPAGATATRALLCRVAARPLTRGEWREFLPAERYRDVCAPSKNG